MAKIRLNSSSMCSVLVLTALFFGSIGLLEGQTATAPAIGDGTRDNPYQIATLENLYWIAAHSEVVPEPNMGVRWRSHYIQTANINAAETRQWFNGQGWPTIADRADWVFRGSYNGQGHTIDGLFVNREREYTGLFGMTLGATIENLGLTNVDITGQSNTGTLVGWLQSTRITNCYSTGDVRGRGDVGGLVGRSCSGNIVSNSYSTATVTGTSGVGGFVGYSCCHSPLNDCYSTGNVNGNVWVGGLVGIALGLNLNNSYYNYEQVLINDRNVLTIGALNNEMYNTWFENDFSLDIDDYLLLDDDDRYRINSVNDFKKLVVFGQFEEYSYKLTTNLNLVEYPDLYIPYFSGNFDGDGFVVDNLRININSRGNLGLFGYTSSSSTVENIGVTNVDIIGYGHIGGLVGTNCGTINNCYSTGRVNGYVYTGGLVGTSRGLISNSYSTVSVTAAGFAGGLVGWSFGWPHQSTIRDSYSTGSVEGGSSIGGLVGYVSDSSTITNSYSTGSVTGDMSVGGLVGSARGLNLNNSYSTGSVEGDRYVGGLVGERSGETTTWHSYWNTETSGQVTSAGGEGRTTEQMTYPYDESTYVNWAFNDVWGEDNNGINNGYPYLQWQFTMEPDIAANPFPEDSASHIFADLEHLSWNFMDEPFRSSPTGFRVYFNDSGEFGEEDEFVWVPYIEDQERHATGEILPERLDYFTRYYWKVVPTTKEDGVGDGYDALDCPVWSFTTELNPNPIASINPYPSDETTVVSVDLEELRWEYHVDSYHTNPAGFRVYLNATGEFGDDDDYIWVDYVEEQESYATSEILMEELDYYTTYYWKVVPTTIYGGDDRRTGRVSRPFKDRTKHQNAKTSLRTARTLLSLQLRGDAENVPVWCFTTEADPTSVDLYDPELITSLHGNYPNPFNPETIIQFSIKEDTEASLHIYNFKGQLVKTLHNGMIKAGKHSLLWNGKDERGRDVGSGVYFYRLRAGNVNETRKMLMLR